MGLPSVNPGLGGSGNTNFHDLAMRLRNIELMLSSYTETDIVSADPNNSENNRRVTVMAKQGSSVEGNQLADCPLGYVSGGTMTPGWVIGPNKSVLLEPEYSGSGYKNRQVWVKATWTAKKIDGVLQAGGEMGSVTVHSGSGVPDDNVPNVASLSGAAHYPLGAWDADGNWVNSGCGPVHINFCPGGFIKGRE